MPRRRDLLLLVIVASSFLGCQTAVYREPRRIRADLPAPGASLPEKCVPPGPLSLELAVAYALADGRVEGVSVPMLQRDRLIDATRTTSRNVSLRKRLKGLLPFFPPPRSENPPEPTAGYRAKLQLEQKLTALVLEVEDSYWKLFQSRAILEGRIRILDEIKQQRSQIQRLFEESQITRQELAKMDEQITLLEIDTSTAAAEAHQNAMNLRQVAGFSPGPASEIVLLDAPYLNPPDPNVGQAIQTALIRRPEMTLRHLDLTDAMAAINHVGNKKPISGIFDHERTRLALAEAREAITFSVRKTHLQLVEAFKSAQMFAKRREAVAARVKAIEDKNREKNFRDFPELIQAKRDLVDAQRDEINALCQYRMFQSRYEYEQGLLLCRYQHVPEQPSRVPPPTPVEANDATSDSVP